MPSISQPRKVLGVAGLGEIADRYDAILCDVWGVVHDGRRSFRPASEALVAFRRNGGAVVLITNAPRPSRPIREQILALGVPAEAFDAVVTSGDVTVAMIAERVGQPVHHIGPRRDLSLFEAVEARTGARPELTTSEDAAYVLCTGLFHDDVETPRDYEDRLRAIAARGLLFVCANPDLVIHRGSTTLVYCAGALARRYEELGGPTIYAGKPYSPIYQAALAAAEAALGRPLDPARTLAVGDGMRTDIAGAAAQGLDALFISAGIHRDEVHGWSGRAEAEGLEALFARENLWPYAAARSLAP
jgi:HAD superfamily hydrolase (TIGR01459 family)